MSDGPQWTGSALCGMLDDDLSYVDLNAGGLQCMVGLGFWMLFSPRQAREEEKEEDKEEDESFVLYFHNLEH